MFNEFSKYFFHKLIIAILIIIVTILWSLSSLNVSGGGIFKVTFIDVGQGDSTLIETPNGFQVLIDSGKSSRITEKVSDLIGKTDKKIDMFVVTHADLDHIGGLPSLLKKFDFNYLVRSEWNEDSDTVKIIEKRSESVETIMIDRPKKFTVDGVEFYFLWPWSYEIEDKNAGSVITLVRYGEVSFLLTGDSPFRVEEKIADTFAEIIDVDVLKAGHHGSKTSTSLDFLNKTTPEFLIISASGNNSYGHPHKSVIENASKVNVAVLETSKEGNIYFYSKDMKTLVSETDRENLIPE